MTNYDASSAVFGVVSFGPGGNPTILIGSTEDDVRFAAFQVIRSALGNKAETDVDQDWLWDNDPFAIATGDRRTALEWLHRYHSGGRGEHLAGGNASRPGFVLLAPDDVVDTRRVWQPAH